MKLNETLERYANLQQVQHLHLPRKISYAVARNIERLRSEVRLFEEQRREIAERYARKDEDGEIVVKDGMFDFASKEDEKAFRKEQEELAETEITVEIMKFAASELDKCDEVERYDIMSPAQEAGIEWMIDYGEEAS